MNLHFNITLHAFFVHLTNLSYFLLLSFLTPYKNVLNCPIISKYFFNKSCFYTNISQNKFTQHETMPGQPFLCYTLHPYIMIIIKYLVVFFPFCYPFNDHTRVFSCLNFSIWLIISSESVDFSHFIGDHCNGKNL